MQGLIGEKGEKGEKGDKASTSDIHTRVVYPSVLDLRVLLLPVEHTAMPQAC